MVDHESFVENLLNAHIAPNDFIVLSPTPPAKAARDAWVKEIEEDEETLISVMKLMTADAETTRKHLEAHFEAVWNGIGNIHAGEWDGKGHRFQMTTTPRKYLLRRWVGNYYAMACLAHAELAELVA